jgi:DNA-binding transcriptional LysR family regulator
MELRHLRYFCAVAAHQGFSRAARTLNISQSAISEQVTDLEQEIGVALFVRRRQKIRLTPHGEVFLTEAKRVLAAANLAVETAQRSGRGEIGTLNVGFLNGGTGDEVPNIIKDFRRRYPGVRVSITETIPAEQAQALVNGTLDVGFTRPLEPPFDQLLRSELLYRDPLIAVFPKDHSLARGPVDLRSLAREKFVLVAREASPALFNKIMGLCSAADFIPQIAATGVVWSSLLILVQAGEGIAILPSNLQPRASKDLVFCPLTNRGASFGIVVAWSPHRESAVQGSFLELVREYRRKYLMPPKVAAASGQ